MIVAAMPSMEAGRRLVRTISFHLHARMESMKFAMMKTARFGADLQTNAILARKIKNLNAIPIAENGILFWELVTDRERIRQQVQIARQTTENIMITLANENNSIFNFIIIYICFVCI